MTAFQQYALLLAMAAATIGFVFCLYVIGKYLAAPRKEEGEDTPAASGNLPEEAAWARYHPRYYGYALLFLAFDMEMAYMYPWAVVYKELGLVALLDMGVFLSILFLGLLYGWSQGALRRQ
ncbi:MAG: NADH-quinone oxidoreductase subunit A [Actinomycetota bacterium]|nr:NADH-quinone oxidoreductase subunit A [Rubrobacter sp.]MDQ3509022.1 NADH-quinone oxidoreductase subunit A [Actinomycetota bacterium]